MQPARRSSQVESLSEDESSDDNSDPPPVLAPTLENQTREQRYEESRSIYQTKAQHYPELLRPPRLPMTAKFISMAVADRPGMDSDIREIRGLVADRFKDLRGRKFITQQCISLTDDNLSDVLRVVTKAGLIHTLTDIDLFQPNVVREFIANLPNAQERDDGVAVYVRGSLVYFSPSLINALYCIPGFEEDPNWMDENMDEVCGFLTDGRIRQLENMSSKFLTATNQVLYKLVCANWIPSTNYTSMNQERLRFVYMLHHHEGFDFGKLVYEQILTMAANTRIDKMRRIMFPTLIQQVILFQRVIPPDTRNDEFTGLPTLVVKDIKAGRGTGADSSTASLEEDIDRTIASLKAIRVRLRRGDYVPHPGVSQTEEHDGDDETEEEDENDSE
ncbi:hypothetical protein F2Q70_00027315 [Brassica cretica]|uniref:Putative plant transposon protein domain-containing protein n=1 Tax=Brassica cretica TaxID=69181 RepID=A0A8S9LEH6_BRACR|nr:hypothetical protein F2Q70_00027315 [Brassica cretica]